jgi:hypothetical protein
MALLSELPEGAEVLDLQAARVARAEARSTKSFLKLAAGYVEAKSEVPISAAFKVQAGDIAGALGELLEDPADFDLLIADGLTSGDIEAITVFIAGKPVGESQASLKS